MCENQYFSFYFNFRDFSNRSVTNFPASSELQAQVDNQLRMEIQKAKSTTGFKDLTLTQKTIIVALGVFAVVTIVLGIALPVLVIGNATALTTGMAILQSIALGLGLVVFGVELPQAIRKSYIESW